MNLRSTIARSRSQFSTASLRDRTAPLVDHIAALRRPFTGLFEEATQGMENFAPEARARSLSVERLRSAGVRLAFFALLLAAFGSMPARARNDDDYAGMMGMLWRPQGPICPSMSFDPAAFVKAMKLPGGSPAVRSRHRDAFARGYAVSTDLLSRGTTAEFCQMISTWFDGKHDMSGNLESAPAPPPPGLTFHN
jgi:hypothetical protein